MDIKISRDALQRWVNSIFWWTSILDPPPAWSESPKCRLILLLCPTVPHCRSLMLAVHSTFGKKHTADSEWWEPAAASRQLAARTRQSLVIYACDLSKWLCYGLLKYRISPGWWSKRSATAGPGMRIWYGWCCPGWCTRAKSCGILVAILFKWPVNRGHVVSKHHGTNPGWRRGDHDICCWPSW
jgi:hypothetical protein